MKGINILKHCSDFLRLDGIILKRIGAGNIMRKIFANLDANTSIFSNRGRLITGWAIRSFCYGSVKKTLVVNVFVNTVGKGCAVNKKHKQPRLLMPK